MCFDNRLQHVYHKVVKPVLEDLGFECIRGDEISETGIIIEQVREYIEEATLVICDLTFDNPNVFYELGIAHILNKPTILISQTPANIPFDVRHYRIVSYKDEKLGLLDLRDELTKSLGKMFDFSNLEQHKRIKELPISKDELEDQRTALFSNYLDSKRYAIKFLGDVKDTFSFNKIQMIALEDGNADIKREAFTALHKINPEKAKPILIEEGLRWQKEYIVRERVVTLLGSYQPDKELLDRILSQKGDTSWGVRRSVCEVLGRWGERKAITPLREMLTDSEQQVRLAAVEALGRLQSNE